MTSLARKRRAPSLNPSCQPKSLLMAKKKNHKTPPATIAVNRQARHEFALDESIEAGLALEGWEVKSLREGRIQLKESYVSVHAGEAWLMGSHISPLISASTHINPNPLRQRKLLMHRTELNRFIGAVERRGYTLVPLRLYWKRGNVKLELALGRGKKLHDKRATSRDRDWNRQKQRILKAG